MSWTWVLLAFLDNPVNVYDDMMTLIDLPLRKLAICPKLAVLWCVTGCLMRSWVWGSFLSTSCQVQWAGVAWPGGFIQHGDLGDTCMYRSTH